MNTFHEFYRDNIVPSLMEHMKVSSPMEVPRLTKITINMGLGSAVNDKKILIITNNIDNNFLLSSRNLKNVNLVNVDSFSTYDIVNSSYLLFDKNSVDFLNKKLMK